MASFSLNTIIENYLLLTIIHFQNFGELEHRPLLVDLTIEDQSRLKVIYGSAEGFHAVDLDSAEVYDIYLPKHVSRVLNGNASKKYPLFCWKHRKCFYYSASIIS